MVGIGQAPSRLQLIRRSAVEHYQAGSRRNTRVRREHPRLFARTVRPRPACQVNRGTAVVVELKKVAAVCVGVHFRNQQLGRGRHSGADGELQALRSRRWVARHVLHGTSGQLHVVGFARLQRFGRRQCQRGTADADLRIAYRHGSKRCAAFQHGDRACRLGNALVKTEADRRAPAHLGRVVGWHGALQLRRCGICRHGLAQHNPVAFELLLRHR